MSTYNERKELYIQNNINSTNYHALLLQASKNSNLSNNLITNAVKHYQDEIVKTKDNSDFDLIFFIRLLYLLKNNNHPSFQSLFLTISDLFKHERFWLTKNESAKCYWSENHMICYLSSWYLWNQLNNICDTQCNLLLTTYLETKSKYAFYEAFSQVYNMYTLSALLNIYDFSLDTSLKSLALQSVNTLCKQFLEVNLLNGSTFCASTRTYERYKISSLSNNHNKLIHLLSGNNQENTISPVGVFMVTSTFVPNIDYSKFTKKYNVTYNIGTLKAGMDFDKVYSKLSRDDKTLFQWSAGNYFNEHIDDTLDLMDKYNLDAHSHFKSEPYTTILNLFPKSVLKSTSSTLKAFTDCSDLTNINYNIYNHGNYSLTCLENYNRGKLGAQQLPFIINLDGTPIFTQSGKVSSVGNLDEANGNSHLPYVKQEKNIALVMYQPYDLIKSSAKAANLDLTVYLYLNQTEFDEVVQNKNWIFVRKNNSYAAIYSTSLKKDSSNNYYNDNSSQQGWIFILGNSSEYNDFTTFQNQILQKCSYQFKVVKPNKSIWDKLTDSDNYYYGKISFNNISFDMKW